MNKPVSHLSRRQFLVSGTVAGGAFMLGMTSLPNVPSAAVTGTDAPFQITTWVKVTPDNRIIVINPHTEMGQGVHTSLPMIVAEEMDADWSLVEMEQAPAEKDYANYLLAKGYVLGDTAIPGILVGITNFTMKTLANMMVQQITGGSTAVQYTGWHGLRNTGAAAKEMLVSAAAKRLNVDRSSLKTEKSHVVHDATGQRIPYGDLAADAAEMDVPGNPQLKSPDAYSIIGKRVQRLDIPAKVDGTAEFGIDVRLDNMVYASVANSPVFDGTVQRFDGTAASERKGVAHVLDIGNAVAVVADGFWQAQSALADTEIVFDEGEKATLSSEGLSQSIDASLTGQLDTKKESGNVEDALASAEKIVESHYRAPYLNHSCLEPMNCTVWLRDGKLDIWGGMQNPLNTKNMAVDKSGLDDDKVTVHPRYMGGGFGRRARGDIEMQAVAIAMAMNEKGDNRPVQLIWSREEDMQHGLYRMAGASAFRAALSQDGKIEAWQNSLVSDEEPTDAWLIPYTVPNQLIKKADWENPIPSGPWRSVAHSTNAFYTEGFMDELAAEAGEDPYSFRLKHLPEDSRDYTLLKTVAEKAGWSEPLAAKPGMRRGKGIAIHQSFNTRVAEVVETSIEEDGTIHVDRVVAAVDCGIVINPDTVEAQIQSGIIFGLSAALYQKNNIEQGRVVETNFPDFEMVRLETAPEIEVHIMDNQFNPSGIGEPGTPPVAPALANAIFAATGKRLREMPFVEADLTA